MKFPDTGDNRKESVFTQLLPTIYSYCTALSHIYSCYSTKTAAMFLKRLILFLSVITAARFGLCQNNSSFNDVVDRFPDCTRSCFQDLFNDLYADTCGDVQSSTDLKDIACFCGDGPGSGTEYSEDVFGPCLQDSCPKVDSDDVSDFTDPLADLIKWCTPAIEEYGVVSGEFGGKILSFFSVLEKKHVTDINQYS